MTVTPVPPQRQLAEILSGNVVLLGVGNADRGDDALGPELISRISKHVDACCINAGAAPENYLEKVVRAHPDVILIIDAANFGKEPGRIQVFPSREIVPLGISTHALSLNPACQYLENRIPGVKIFLLAVQPAHTDRHGLSKAVKESLDALVRTFDQLQI